ncbi:MAG: beta-galactosidase [Candidatus Omnitrophota bacterium]
MSRKPINKILFLLAAMLLFSSGPAAGEFSLGGDMSHHTRDLLKDNQDNPFGVLEFLHWNHSWNNYKYPGEKEIKKAVSLMRSAGAGWVRLDFLWEDIEPSEGSFNFEKYDNIVRLLTEQGICVLGILNYSTDWASSCGKWNCSPKDNRVFLNYASQVIRRYKDRVKYWELWNEPDSAVYWNPQDGLKSYCALLKEVYREAKRIDPHCKILNGGLANGISSVNRLYEAGAGGYFDILNLHFFQNPLEGKNSIKAVAAYPKLAYKIMKRNGDAGKKIWITETGCPGVKTGLDVKCWWLGKNPNERVQAQWVKEVYTELLKDPEVEKVFWAFFRDTKGHWGDGVDYFGLVRWDYSLKPAFKAYKNCYLRWKENRDQVHEK